MLKSSWNLQIHLMKQTHFTLNSCFFFPFKFFPNKKNGIYIYYIYIYIFQSSNSNRKKHWPTNLQKPFPKPVTLGIFPTKRPLESAVWGFGRRRLVRPRWAHHLSRKKKTEEKTTVTVFPLKGFGDLFFPKWVGYEPKNLVPPVKIFKITYVNVFLVWKNNMFYFLYLFSKTVPFVWGFHLVGFCKKETQPTRTWAWPHGIKGISLQGGSTPNSSLGRRIWTIKKQTAARCIPLVIYKLDRLRYKMFRCFFAAETHFGCFGV